MPIVSGLLTAVAGVPATVQSGAALDETSGQPILVAFVVVATRLAALPLLGMGWPAPERFAQAPWWAWIGGVFGGFHVPAALLFADRLGAAIFKELAVTAGAVIHHADATEQARERRCSTQQPTAPAGRRTPCSTSRRIVGSAVDLSFGLRSKVERKAAKDLRIRPVMSSNEKRPSPATARTGARDGATRRGRTGPARGGAGSVFLRDRTVTPKPDPPSASGAGPRGRRRGWTVPEMRRIQRSCPPPATTPGRDPSRPRTPSGRPPPRLHREVDGTPCFGQETRHDSAS